MAEEYEVRFVYRVLNKTTEGYQLLEVKDKVFDMYQDATWTDGENTYWPVDPKDVENLREKGVLLTEIRGHLHLVTQEIIGTIFRNTYQDAWAVANHLHAEGDFSVIKVTTTWMTEVFAK